ncbi:MAG: alpha/beta hydrolase, partial [Pseudomonadota bacterium]
MPEYIVCVRNVEKGKFGAEPGATKFLKMPSNVKAPKPSHGIKKTDWFAEVLQKAISGKNDQTGEDYGDILVFVHGYNNDQEIVMRRHKQIKRDLSAIGYQGVVVSFDWPSDDRTLNYLEDRSDAKQTAIKLVDDCIRAFSIMQKSECEINVHLLAHSTGAYVVREAFDDADDRPRVAEKNWAVSQIMLIGADVSSKSMSANDSKSSSIYRHCVRLTNYSNPYDSVLKLSNVKRVGVAPRVGRTGLPEGAPGNAINVNCGEYYSANEKKIKAIGTKSHSWHIGDKAFAKDMY